MTRTIGLVAASVSVLLLSACGGGGGAGESEGPSGAVVMDSKADALREFSLSGFTLAIIGGSIPDAGAGGGTAPAAAKSLGRHGSWGAALPQAPESVAKFGGGQGPCPEGGRSDFTDAGSAAHSFVFFGNRNETVDFAKGLDSQCIHAQQNGAMTTLQVYNGRHERGTSDIFNDGSELGYRREGVGSERYTKQYEERQNGTPVYSVREDLRGETEMQWFANGASEVRTIYSYRFSDSDDYTAQIDLGSGSTPFKGFHGGSSVRLDGTYAYHTTECSGGRVVVSTLQPVTLDGNGNPNGGQVRLVSGNSTATFSFNGDGSATLNLNGATLGVTPGEVQDAVNDIPC